MLRESPWVCRTDMRQEFGGKVTDSRHGEYLSSCLTSTRTRSRPSEPLILQETCQGDPGANGWFRHRVHTYMRASDRGRCHSQLLTSSPWSSSVYLLPPLDSSPSLIRTHSVSNLPTLTFLHRSQEYHFHALRLHHYPTSAAAHFRDDPRRPRPPHCSPAVRTRTSSTSRTDLQLTAAQCSLQSEHRESGVQSPLC